MLRKQRHMYKHVGTKTFATTVSSKQDLQSFLLQILCWSPSRVASTSLVWVSARIFRKVLVNSKKCSSKRALFKYAPVCANMRPFGANMRPKCALQISPKLAKTQKCSKNLNCARKFLGPHAVQQTGPAARSQIHMPELHRMGRC